MSELRIDEHGMKGVERETSTRGGKKETRRKSKHEIREVRVGGGGDGALENSRSVRVEGLGT